MRKSRGRLVRIVGSGACGVAVTVAALFALASGAGAKPQPGDLDRSFNGNGVALTAIPPRSSYADAVAIGRKRRIVVAGYKGTSKGLAVARYKPNGHLDHSFSRDGRLTTGFGDERMLTRAVAIDRDGSIVVAGRSCYPCSFAVVKFQPDGKLDKSFGNGGRVRLAFPANEYSQVNSVAFTSSGRVVLGGTACPKSVVLDCKFALARLDQSGRPDATFGDRGRVITQVEDENGDPHDGGATGMAIDSRGRTLLGGDADGIALARYKPNGQLDGSFGNDGEAYKVPRDFSGGVPGIALDSKGRILVAWSSSSYSLFRFGRDGKLDRSFGKRGRAGTDAIKGNVFSMAIDSRNRTVLAGGPYCTLVRFRPNGKLSKSFGHKGITRLRKHGPERPDGLAIDSHDRAVAVGSGTRRGSARRVFAVARFLG